MTLQLNGLRGFAMSDSHDVLLYMSCAVCKYKIVLYATEEGRYFTHCGLPMFITQIEVYKNNSLVYKTKVIDNA